MNLPNKITLARVILIPFFLLALYIGKIYQNNVWDYVALAIFIIASLSDLIDGKIARKRNIVTSLGKFLDPLADKLLVTSAIVWFVQEAKISSIIAIVIIAREFIVTGLRTLAANQGIVIAASYWGKLKTVTQLTGIILILINGLYPFNLVLDPINKMIGIELYTVVMWVATVMTLISGWDYVAKNLGVFKEKK